MELDSSLLEGGQGGVVYRHAKCKETFLKHKT